MKDLDTLYTEISDTIIDIINEDIDIGYLERNLSRSNLIDVTQDACRFFYHPIEANRSDVVDLLIKYFFKQQLSKYDKSSNEYIALIKTLRDHTLDWTEEYGRSEEMQQALLPLNINDKLEIITAISDTQSTNVDSDLLEIITEFDEELSICKATQSDLSNNTSIFELYSQIFDVIHDNLLDNNRCYRLDFKYLVQDMLIIKSVTEVKCLLDSIAEPLNAVRVPSLSTLHRWKGQINLNPIDELPNNTTSSLMTDEDFYLDQRLLTSNALQQLNEASIEDKLASIDLVGQQEVTADHE